MSQAQPSEAISAAARRRILQQAWSKVVPPENFVMFFPTETETTDFLTNMPDIETVRKAAEDTIAKANHSQTHAETGKRKVLGSEDDLIPDMPASKKKAIVVGDRQVMTGFSDIPSQAKIGTRQSSRVLPVSGAGKAVGAHSGIGLGLERGTGPQSGVREGLVSGTRPGVGNSPTSLANHSGPRGLGLGVGMGGLPVLDRSKLGFEIEQRADPRVTSSAYKHTPEHSSQHLSSNSRSHALAPTGITHQKATGMIPQSAMSVAPQRGFLSLQQRRNTSQQLKIANQPQTAETSARRLSHSSQALLNIEQNIPGPDEDGPDEYAKACKKVVEDIRVPEPVPAAYEEERRRLENIFNHIKTFRQKAILEKEEANKVTYQAFLNEKMNAEDQKQKFKKIWDEFEACTYSREKRNLMIANYEKLIAIPKGLVGKVYKKWELEQKDLKRQKDELDEWVRAHKARGGKALLEREVASMMFNEQWFKDEIDTFADFRRAKV